MSTDRLIVESAHYKKKCESQAAQIAALTAERDALRKRVKCQRTELRRLNKYLGPYWAGFRRGIDFELSKLIRIRMFKEFGQPAVFVAEHKDDASSTQAHKDDQPTRKDA